VSAIAWAMWAYGWRAALGQTVVSECLVAQSARSRSAFKSTTCACTPVVSDGGPARAATQADQCTSCLRFGHIAANCPDEAWRLR
jgi:hypothetical protein